MNTSSEHTAGSGAGHGAPDASGQTPGTGHGAPGADGYPPGAGGGQGGGTPGNPPPGDAPQPGGFFAAIRRTGLVRTNDRWIGGVAAGLARRLDVDPLLVRGILVVLTFFGGLGLLLYGLGWALLPEEYDGRIHLQEAGRGNVDAALAGAAVFVLIGLARPVFWWDTGWWFFGWLLTTGIVIAGVALLLAWLMRRRDSAASQPGPVPHPGPPAPHATGPGHGDPSGAPVPGGAGAAPPAGAMPLAPTAPASASTTGAPEGSAPATPAGPPAATATAAPPRPARPPRPTVPGPGRGVVSVVLAVCLLLLAAMTVWNRIAPQVGLASWSSIADPGLIIALTGLGAMLVALGIGVALSALRGRRGRGLSVLGVLLAIVVVPMTVLATVLPPDLPGGREHAHSSTFADERAAPRSLAVAEGGYSVRAGNLVVDLTELDLEEIDGEDVIIPIDISAGNAEVLLPRGAVSEIHAEIGLGNLEVRSHGGWTSEDGALLREEFSAAGIVSTTFHGPLTEGTDTGLILDIRVGTGNIQIEERP